MGNLSKNFSRKEFTCQCGCGFDNVDLRLVKTLQVIRDAAQHPIVIMSGCRCSSHNKIVGGVANSSHLKGLAADFYVVGWNNTRLGNLIRSLYIDGLIPHMSYTYKIKGKTNTSIHLDIDKDKNRRNKFGTGY